MKLNPTHDEQVENQVTDIEEAAEEKEDIDPREDTTDYQE